MEFSDIVGVEAVCTAAQAVCTGVEAVDIVVGTAVDIALGTVGVVVAVVGTAVKVGTAVDIAVRVAEAAVVPVLDIYVEDIAELDGSIAVLLNGAAAMLVLDVGTLVLAN